MKDIKKNILESMYFSYSPSYFHNLQKRIHNLHHFVIIRQNFKILHLDKTYFLDFWKCTLELSLELPDVLPLNNLSETP